MSERLVEVSLFGACDVRSAKPDGFVITGAKHKALFALLTTAPAGRRARTYLQDMLWGRSALEGGRQNLRRALSDIKKLMGDQTFAQVFTVNNSDISIDVQRVRFKGRPGTDDFLQGIDIQEDGFEDWLRSIRQNPEQLAGLFSTATHPTPDMMAPTVAILPFQVVFGAPTYAVLGDWIAQEVSRSLSRSNLLQVISHLSCRELSSRVVEVTAIRNHLRAHYTVVGSLREWGGKIILDADFVETSTGRLLWTRQFVNAPDDFMGLASESVQEIAQSIGGAIADTALAYHLENNLAHLQDHHLVVAGVRLMHRTDLSSFQDARRLLVEATRRAPQSAEAWAWRGKWHALSVINNRSADTAADKAAALDCTSRALDLQPSNSFALTIDGMVQNNLMRRLDLAAERYQTALKANPNESLAWLLSGTLQAFTDDGAAAVVNTEKARRLSPMDPFGYFYDALSSSACLAAGDFDRALELANKSLEANWNYPSTWRVKITALHQLEKFEELKEAGEELLRLQPDETVDGYLRRHPAAEHASGRLVAEAMKAADIPESNN